MNVNVSLNDWYELIMNRNRSLWIVNNQELSVSDGILVVGVAIPSIVVET